MWTLDGVRTKLADRLAESSTAFWGADERDYYINQGQRFVAALTRGVETEAEVSHDGTVSYVTIPDALGPGKAGAFASGRALLPVQQPALDAIDPRWRTRSGSPRHYLLDLAARRIYLIPNPTAATTITLSLAVMPAELTSDAQGLFDGQENMARYADVVVNYAAALALLKERYDGDAERFYQFAAAQLRDFGVADVPAWEEVRRGVDGGGAS